MQSTRRILIFTSVIVLLFSSLAFASDLSLPDQSPDPEQEPLEVNANSLTLQTKTMELRAVEKSITDVYNLLDDALFGNSTFAGGMLAQIADQITYWVSGTQYTIADLQGMTWSIANSINNKLTSTNSILGNIYNENYTTNRKLEYVFSAIEDTINIKWYDSSFSYNGTSRGLDTNFLSSNAASRFFYVSFDFNSTVTPQLFRVSLPLRYVSPNLDVSSDLIFSHLFVSSDFNSWEEVPLPSEFFIEPTSNGIYLYLFNFQPYSSYHYYFQFTSSPYLQYRTFYSAEVFSIPFDTLDYQIIKTAFYQAKSADSDIQSLDQLVQISAQLSTLAQSSQSGSEAAEALADYIVSPEKQAAEDASSQVINSTLNNFTGNGSGAAKSSDSNAMKDVSGSLQSGLDAGGSVSGATGVFNSGSDFWGWFTQQNSNYINNPYPAPTVNSTRGSGDEIVDFLTPNSNELQDLLRQGGDQR